MSTPSRLGTPRVLKTATTAMGSVAARRAANTRPWMKRKSCTKWRAPTTGVRSAAVTAMDAMTPGTASDTIVTLLRQNLEKSR